MDKYTTLNIWIVNHYALPPGWGGSSRHNEFAQGLVKKGYDVTIICSDIHYNSYRRIKNISKSQDYLVEIIGGVRYCFIRTFPYSKNNWRRYINILSFTFRLKLSNKIKTLGKPDVIIGSSFHPFTPYKCGRFAKRFKVPFIAEIRDLWPETLIQLGYKASNPLVYLLSRIEKSIYRESDKIIVLFDNAHSYILNLNIEVPVDKIYWIPNGVNVSEFSSKIGSIKNTDKKYAIENKFNVLNAGSLGNVYALEYFIMAAKSLMKSHPEVHFHFIGSGPLEFKLKNLKLKYVLDNVSFHGSVRKQEMPYVLQEFDVLYASLMKSPLYKWGMSLNKLHEYLAAGKPIVFGYQYLENPVTKANCGLTVDPEDSKSISKGILDLYKMPSEKRKALGLNGVKYVQSKHDFTILVNKLERIIHEVI